jgi:two-component system cell cycle sensor histidine kinase PleC
VDCQEQARRQEQELSGASVVRAGICRQPPDIPFEGGSTGLQFIRDERFIKSSHKGDRTLTGLKPVQPIFGPGRRFEGFRVVSVVDLSRKTALPSMAGWTAGSLALPLPTLSEKVSCGQAFDWFNEHSDQRAAAVLDEEGRVIGIVNRLRFLSRYARRYYPELYSKHSVMKLANPKPLVVDCEMSAFDLGAAVVFEHPDALIECFVVIAGGRYFGIATGEALMRCKVDLLVAQQENLKRAMTGLSEASKAKSSFLALMSHELRTPLNAIIGFSEVIAGEYFGAIGSERYRSYAADIHGAGRHLLALINDILDLSKAEAGKLDLHCEDVDLGAIVGDCVKLIAEKARNQGIKVEINISSKLPKLYGDALRLKQILVNLLSNAVKFTPAGSVEIAAERRADGELMVSVTDTGVGMAPEAIPIALEPFRQIDSSLSRKFEGTGLGLSLVKSLVEHHQGRLEIESAVDRGTKVRVFFPPSRVRVAEAASSA